MDEQLRFECFELLNQAEDFADEVLTGELAIFCEGTGSVPPVGAGSGGGAATPVSAPGLIQQQQRERLLAAAEGDEAPLAASGDAARLEIGHRWSVFALGHYANIDKKRNNFADAYDSDRWGANIGGSYRFHSQALAGLAFDYFHESGDYKGGGDFEIDSYGLIAFGSITGKHFVFQGSGGYAKRDYERTRRAEYVAFENGGTVARSMSGKPRADFDGDAYFLEASMTSVWRWSEVVLSPFVSLGWSRVEYDAHSEEGDSGLELRFDDERRKSLLSSVGVGLAKGFSAGSIPLVLGADLSWLHEFKDDQRTIKVSFTHDTRPKTFTYSTEKPDRNFGLFGASLVGVLSNGVRPFLRFQTVFANRNFDLYLFTLGLNAEF